MKIAVLIGAEPYQAYHVADIAWSLAERDGVEVEILATLPETLTELKRLERGGRDRSVPRRLLHTPPYFRAMQGISLLGSLKQLVLRDPRNLQRLSGYDAIVTPTDHVGGIAPLLRPRPRLVYVSHGIGGRAASYSDKYRPFDFVLVASRNDEARLLADHRISQGGYSVIGYPKFETCRRLSGPAPQLFTNGAPTVLFNTHSKRSLRSWEKFARPLVAHARRIGDFNLIVAPHAKLFNRRPRLLWRSWERLAIPGHVIVDLGSSRAYDMSYCLAADIYVGDVSSQVYEFLDQPKPCVFLNAHRLPWQDNRDFPNWDLGDVVETPSQAIRAIIEARGRHQNFIARQIDRLEHVVDRTPGAAARGAEAILDFIHRDARC
jgi:hypothetical protein